MLIFRDRQPKFNSWIYHKLTCFPSLSVNSFLSATSIFSVRFLQGLLSLNMPTENATGRGASDPEKQKTHYQVTYAVSPQCCELVWTESEAL